METLFFLPLSILPGFFQDFQGRFGFIMNFKLNLFFTKYSPWTWRVFFLPCLSDIWTYFSCDRFPLFVKYCDTIDYSQIMVSWLQRVHEDQPLPLPKCVGL